MNGNKELNARVLTNALAWSTRWLNEAIIAGEALHVGSGQGHGPVDHQARARRLEHAADTKPWEHLYAAEELTGENPKNLVKPAQQKSPESKVAPAGPWTAALWEATGDIWRDILELPFIRGLGDGTLDEDLFGFYLDQDAQYLAQYSRALATLSARATSSQGQVHWAAGAQAAIVEESLLHDEWLAAHSAIPAEQGGIRRGAPSAVTMGYTNFYVLLLLARIMWWAQLRRFHATGCTLRSVTGSWRKPTRNIRIMPGFRCMAAKILLRMCAAAWRLLRKHLSRLPQSACCRRAGIYERMPI